METPGAAVAANKLLRYYESRCAASSKRGASLIMAIPRGLGADCVAINLELTKQAMLNQSATSYSAVIEDLFQGNTMLFLPCTNAYNETVDGLDENEMTNSERAMRQGYARDRVIAINQVKRAMLNQGKIGASEDFIRMQLQTPEFLKEWFSKFEGTIAQAADVSKPSTALAIKRAQWARLVDSDPDALNNQATFLQATPLTGTTRLQAEALAIDPRIESDLTLSIAILERQLQGERDRELGTETFVSFTFPPAEHELLVAAAAVDGGVATSANSYSYPAMVTFHSATGEAVPLAAAGISASTDGPNILMIGDAADLITRVHALAAEAGHPCVILEHT